MESAQTFLEDRLKKIFSQKRSVIDIGGGLRIDKTRGNRYDESLAWLHAYIDNGVRYQILDPIPDYNPDIIGDIHNLPFATDSQQALICMSVLEHVENPIQASSELYRVLEPSGHCLVYVPFLYYYHAERGYYKDYWRFTHDTLELLFKEFTLIEIKRVNGPIATLLKLTPLGRSKIILNIARRIDPLVYRNGSNQTSGYFVFLQK